MKPIGIFKSPGKTEKLQAARQGVDDHHLGEIQLDPGFNFEQALEGLEGFSHLWVIYQFHLNKSWKTKVLPPRLSNRKIGVFATRSPYRPNPIGLSLVKIVSIRGRNIKVSQSDLLDQTPIFDLKPYIPYSDFAAGAKTGWFKKPKALKLKVSSKFKRKNSWLKSQNGIDLLPVIKQQLLIDPLNANSKRVSSPKPSGRTKKKSGLFIFALRKWRIQFQLGPGSLELMDLQSNFQVGEAAHVEDQVHREFLKKFTPTGLYSLEISKTP